MLIVMALFISAITFEPGIAEVKTLSTYWKQEKYSQNGKPTCVVTSGAKGFSVVANRKPRGVLGISVKSNRKLPSGGIFSINIGNKKFTTSEEYLPTGRSVEILQAMNTDSKAYLEWSDIPSDRHGSTSSSNMIPLEGFTSKFNQCKRSLLGALKPLK